MYYSRLHVNSITYVTINYNNMVKQNVFTNNYKLGGYMNIKTTTTVSSDPSCIYCGGDDVIIDEDSLDCDGVIQITPCPICLSEFWSDETGY